MATNIENIATLPRINTESLTDLNKESSVYHNALLHAADPIFQKLLEVKFYIKEEDEPHSLRETLCTLIQTFENTAKLNGVPAVQILMARYMLCTTLDEAILQLPWGEKNNWGEDSLLSRFHDDTWGGEQCFIMLERLKSEANFNINVLELIYVCISLGFRGKYLLREQGQEELELKRQQLWELLEKHHHIVRKNEQKVHSPIALKPLLSWKRVVLMTIAALGLVYGSFYTILNHTLSPVVNQTLEALDG